MGKFPLSSSSACLRPHSIATLCNSRISFLSPPPATLNRHLSFFFFFNFLINCCTLHFLLLSCATIMFSLIMDTSNLRRLAAAQLNLPDSLPTIPATLDSTNYFLWKNTISPLLKSYKLFGYADGSIPTPPPAISVK